MKIKIKHVIVIDKEGQVKINEGLQGLLDTKLPIKIGYALSKLMNNLQSDLVVFTENRNKIIIELGEDMGGGKYNVKPENLEKYAKDLLNLLDVEIEVEWTKIKIEDLGDISIEPKFILDWLFE